MEGDKNINKFTDLPKSVRSKALHQRGVTADQLSIQGRRDLDSKAGELHMKRTNVEQPKIKAKRLFAGIRTLARGAGQSNNPIANLGGDLVGAVMDGVSYLEIPQKKRLLI